MSARTQLTVLFVLAGSLCLPPSNAAQTRHPKQKQSLKAPELEPLSTTPPPPVDPPTTPTLEQIPSGPVIITYFNGRLTIDARNSTLSDVLQAVCNQTGAVIDIPDEANERVQGRIGPGQIRDVLANLLNGSHFNYVMMGSAADPNALARIILAPKSGGSAGDNNGSNPANGGQRAALPRSFPARSASYQPPPVETEPMAAQPTSAEPDLPQQAPPQQAMSQPAPPQEIPQSQPVMETAGTILVRDADGVGEKPLLVDPVAQGTAGDPQAAAVKARQDVLQNLFEQRRQMIQQQQQQQTPQ